MDQSILVSINHHSDVEKDISVTIAAEEVQNTYNLVYNKIQKTAEMKGFRAGKVPRDLIEQKYKTVVEQQVDTILLNKAYNEAIDGNNYEAIGSPNVKDFKYELDGSYSVNIYLEVKPNFDPQGYLGLTLEEAPKLNMEDALEKRLMTFQKRATDGDGIADADDALAKHFGYGTLDRMKEHLTEEINLAHEDATRVRYENQILTALYSVNKFSIPKTLLKKQTTATIESLKQQFGYGDDMAEDIKEEIAKISELQLTREILLEKIYAKEKENIKDVGHHSDHLEKIAKRNNMTKEELLQNVKGDYLNLMMQIRDNNVFEFILENAKIIKPKLEDSDGGSSDTKISS